MSYDPQAIQSARRSRELLCDALRDAGASVNGKAAIRCPWHDDKSPSGSIHADKSGGYRFKCHSGCGWNDGQDTGDVLDVIRRVDGLDFAGACKRLSIPKSNGQATQQTKATTKRESNPSNPKAETTARNTDTPKKPARDTKADAERYHHALLADADAIANLWQSRGIDKPMVEATGIGIAEIRGREWWTFPVCDDGGNHHALKLHARDGGKPKSLWEPSGCGSSWAYPISIDAAGLVWVCPGELKAVAVSMSNRAAIGITSGESVHTLPDFIIERLRGREVALPADADATGEKWAAAICEQLTQAGIVARVVDYGAGEGDDIGDVLRRRFVDNCESPEAVGRFLDGCWQNSGPWGAFQIGKILADPQTWRPIERIETGFPSLDKALGGGLRVRGVHLFTGKPGQCKTQLAVATVLNAASRGVSTGIISIELPRDEISKLMVSMLSGIPRRVFESGNLGTGYRDSTRQGVEKLSSLPIVAIDDDGWRGGLDRDGLENIIGNCVADFGWRLVLVDYLGLLATPESDRSDYTTDLLNSTKLKRIAKRFDVALAVIAALRKTSKTTKPEEITLEELSGAGRIAYDAETVCNVWKEYSTPDNGTVHAKILKSRFGPPGDNSTVQLRWVPKTGQILERNHGGHSI